MRKQLKVLLIFALFAILIGINTSRAAAFVDVNPITIGPDSFSAEYRTQYSQQLTAIGGAEPYTFSLLSGTLPDGITLNSSGLLSGLPDGSGAAPGTYPMTIQVVDAQSVTVSRNYGFVVDKGTPSMTALTSIPVYWSRPFNLRADVRMYTGTGIIYPLEGTVDFSIDDNLVLECQDVPFVDGYYFCVGVSSVQPSVGSHTVKAVYTPTEGDKYYTAEASTQFSVDAIYFTIMGDIFRDQNQNGQKDTDEYSLGEGWSVYLDQDCDATVDYTAVTGGYYGYYQFDHVTAGHWYCISTEQRPGYQLTTVPPKIWLVDNNFSQHFGYYYPKIILSPSQLPSAQLGEVINQEFTASGGTGPYTYRISWGTLPDSLTFTEAGVLSGTPTVASSTSIEIEAKDANQAVGTNSYQILVKTDGVFTFTSSSNPSFLGDPVTFTVSASGSVNDPNYGTIPPIGTVTFYVDGTENEDCSGLSLNQFDWEIGYYPVTCVMSALEVGSHEITARFFSFSEIYNTPSLVLIQTVQSGKSSDLSIQKTDGPTQVKAGAKLTYTLKISNLGPDMAQNLTLVDTLDSNSTYVSTVAPKGWTCGHADSVVTCTSSNLAKGKTATITIYVTVKKTAPVGQELVNTANVTSITFDPSLTNNSVTQTNMVRK